MKRVFFLLSVFVCISCSGQALIKPVLFTQRWSSIATFKYRFPLITIAGNTKPANRINDFLADDFLQIDRHHIKKSIFENAWATKESPTPSLSDIDYKVIYNNKKILSLSLSGEGCGAYCEYFTTYYCFDLGTGNIIRPDSLLNTEGTQLLLDSINKSKRHLIETKLAGIRDTLKSQAVLSDKDEKAYFEEMQELYVNCVDNAIESTEYLRSYILKGYLFIIMDRCSAHYNQNADELSEFKFFFKLNDWKKYYTAYANRLLVNN